MGVPATKRDGADVADSNCTGGGGGGGGPVEVVGNLAVRSNRLSSSKDSAVNARAGRGMAGILPGRPRGIARDTFDAGHGHRPASTADGPDLRIHWIWSCPPPGANSPVPAIQGAKADFCFNGRRKRPRNPR